MSRVRRRISRIVGIEPPWVVDWPPIGEVDTQPPKAADQVLGPTNYTPIPDDGFGPRPFLFFYIPASGLDDPTNGFWNTFFNRVPLWEVFADDSHTELSKLLVSPGNVEGISEPIELPLHGNADWIVSSDVTTMAGDRSAYIKNEDKLPNRDPRSIDEGEGSFQYTRVIHYTRPAGSGEFFRTYNLKVLAHQGLLYGGVMYFPCEHSDSWSFTDDGGSSEGGFISSYLDLPPGGVLNSGGYSTTIRIGKREHSSSQHSALGFAAYGFSTPKVDGSGPTSTDIPDVASLEIDGSNTDSDTWIQPNHHVDEIYFGYRSDNSDDATAIYNPTTGHLNMPESDFPLTM